MNHLGKFAPNTNVDSVVESKNADCNTLTHLDSGDFLIIATVDRPVIPAIAFNVRNNDILNALGGGLVMASVDAILSIGTSVTPSPLPPPFSNFRTPSTLQAVVNSVKKNPPTITDSTFSTSYTLPKDWANGNVIKLGTKKTGNHFANNVAPGFNI